MCVERRHGWGRAIAADRRGATALEFALVAPILFVLLLGAIQLGWALHCAASVRWALETSARSLVLDPTLSASDLRSAMVTRLSGLADADHISVTLAADASNPAAKVLRAQSVYTHDLAIAFLPSYRLAFQAATVVPRP